MRHRYHIGFNTNLPVTLHLADGGVVHGVIRELTCEGMSLSLPAGSSLPSGILHAELRLPFAEPYHCRWRASVVRSWDDGAALSFEPVALGDLLPFLAAVRASRSARREGSRTSH